MTRDDRVKHLGAPDWGIGRVLEPEKDGKIKIFFAKAGLKVLTATAPLSRVTGPEASDPALDNLLLGPKGLDSYRTLSELKKSFLKQFPDGFHGSSYQEKERDYKVDAYRLASKLLARDKFKNPLTSDDCDRICEGAKRVLQATNLVFPNEKIKFLDALKSERHRQQFAVALFDILFDEASLEVRFVRLCDVLSEMAADKWTLATYFQFICQPKRYMFMKPLVTIRAAEICAFDLNYKPQPNWLTYQKLLKFAEYLKGALADLQPRDMIDVQSFIWCTGEAASG